PKLTLAPTVATPLFRPFCSLRYFLLAGCSMLHSCRFARTLRCLGRRFWRRLRFRVMRHHFTLEYPDLDADDAVGRLGLGKSIVDVGAQRVEWDPTLAIPLGACDLDAVEPPRAHDLDALRAEAHCVLHRAFHRAAKHDPLFELLRNRVSDELRIDLGFPDLLDVEPDFGAHHLAQACAQRLDVLALLADDHAGARAVYRNARVLRGTLDGDLADRRVRELLFQIFADLDVLVERGREMLAVRVPLGRPVAVDGKAESGRMYLLAHGCPYFFPSPTVTWM